MRKQRPPGSGERVKVARQWVRVPRVRSMTDRDGVAPASTPDSVTPETPADELSEELTRMVKAAYQ